MNDFYIHCIVIVHSLAEDLIKLHQVANAPNIIWHIFQHSNNPDVLQACEKISETDQWVGNVIIYGYQTNRGLSTSWNEGIMNAYGMGIPMGYEVADVAIIINDDMLPGPGDVQKVAQAAMDHPECGLIKCMGTDMRSGSWTPMEYGLTAITKRGWDVVGCFDENISPIYWEDIDHGKRMNEAGLPIFTVQDTSAVHQGSKTSVVQPDGFNLAQQAYDKNMHYYIMKWGGTHLSGEKYKHPFNDSRIGYKIDVADRHDPYARWGISLRNIPK